MCMYMTVHIHIHIHTYIYTHTTIFNQMILWRKFYTTKFENPEKI